MSSNEHLMTCGYTSELRTAPLAEAKALFGQHLELLRPNLAELDPEGRILNDVFGIDEHGFDESGVDQLYLALVEGYEAIQAETGLMSAYPFRMPDGSERWFTIVGGDGYSEDPFEGWGSLWVLLHAIEFAPAIKRLGVYGMGIVNS